MDFLPCLSESISDFSNRTESHEVTGFVGCEGVVGNAKEGCEFTIGIPFFDQVQGFLVGLECLVSSGIDQHQGMLDKTASLLNVVGQFCKCVSEVGDIVHQNIPCACNDITFKAGAQRQSFHRVGPCVKHLSRLNNFRVGNAIKNQCSGFGQHLRNGIVAAGFACVWSHKHTAWRKPKQLAAQKRQRQIGDQCNGFRYITAFGLNVTRVLLELNFIVQHMPWRAMKRNGVCTRWLLGVHVQLVLPASCGLIHPTNCGA